MTTSVGVIGAPSSLGVRPYPDGEMRNLDRAPGVLRERGVIHRVGALDMGIVEPPPYVDFVRPPGRPRNEQEVVDYSRAIGNRVASVIRTGHFAVVLGGDCSVALGCLVGARDAVGRPVGLVSLDAHVDAEPLGVSLTGAAAGMSLALAMGEGDTPLARLGGEQPLLDARHLAVVGHRGPRGSRDSSDWAEQLRAAGAYVAGEFGASTGGRPIDLSALLKHIASNGARRFWIQLDVDVLNPSLMPAVATPVPGGPTVNELIELLGPLVHHRKALGLSFTNYDPALDPDRSAARLLLTMLDKVFKR